MPKRRRIYTANTLHFVTFTVKDFVPVFSIESVALRLRGVLEFYEKKGTYRLHAYVIMPEHVHLLIERLADKSVGEIVRDIKKYFSHVYRSDFYGKVEIDDASFKGSQGFKFWQVGFDEVTIASEKQYFIKLNYILNNPVRRRLVEQAEDYPFCSASIHKRSGRV